LRRGRRFAGDADFKSKGDKMHQGLTTDTVALDRGAAAERCRPEGNIVVDFQTWRISANNEALIGESR
jgi:hypothetical protein